MMRFLAATGLVFAGQVFSLDDPEDGAGAVVKLTTDNFDATLDANKYNMVKFYAPWCGHCKAIAEPYEEAAKMMAGIEGLVFSEVDATEEVDLAGRHGVQGYPTIMWFEDGSPEEYTGTRTAEGFVKWAEDKLKASLEEVETEEEIQEKLSLRLHGDATYVYRGDDAFKEIVLPIADELRILGHHLYVKNEVASITVYKGVDESEAMPEDTPLDADGIMTWAAKARVPMFGQITEENYEIYVESAKNGMFWVCFDPKTLDEDLKTLSPAVVEAAKQDPTFPMVWLDTDEFETHAKQELGCSTFPAVVLQRGDLLGEKEDPKIERFRKLFADDKSEFTTETLVQFLKDIADGKVEALPEKDELSELDDDDDEPSLDDMDDEAKEEL